MSLLGTGCGDESRTTPGTVTATATATGTAGAAECNARPPQTGAGCDVEGIRTAVRAEVAADGGVGLCYRTHGAHRPTGRVLMRIVLAPDGAAASVSVAEDGLDNPDLAGCLRDLLHTLRYPPPGDVPCTALYPMNFQ